MAESKPLTSAEHEVLDAARAAVEVRHDPRVTVADITKQPEKLARLVRAVVKLNRERAPGKCAVCGRED